MGQFHISIAWVPQQLREYDVTRDADSIGQGGGGALWVQEQQTDKTVLTITKAPTETTNCTRRTKKWRARQKFFSGILRRTCAPPPTLKLFPAPLDVTAVNKSIWEKFFGLIFGPYAFSRLVYKIRETHSGCRQRGIIRVNTLISFAFDTFWAQIILQYIRRSITLKGMMWWFGVRKRVICNDVDEFFWTEYRQWINTTRFRLFRQSCIGIEDYCFALQSAFIMSRTVLSSWMGKFRKTPMKISQKVQLKFSDSQR